MQWTSFIVVTIILWLFVAHLYDILDGRRTATYVDLSITAFGLLVFGASFIWHVMLLTIWAFTMPL